MILTGCEPALILPAHVALGLKRVTRFSIIPGLKPLYAWTVAGLLMKISELPPKMST
jgi:hypothetical protein